MPNEIHLSEIGDYDCFPAIASNGSSMLFFDISSTFNHIHITSIAEHQMPGAVIAYRCDECKTITFIWDSFVIRPKDGDYFMVNLCEKLEHNLKLNYVSPPQMFGAMGRI